MSGLWANEGRIAIPFTSLPPAANNNGKIVRCNPLVAGQGYFYMVSDGTYWRPYGGEQKLYVLEAPIDMAVNNTAQKLVSIPIPPGMICCGKSYIKTVLGADKLLGTSDTLTIYQRFGSADTVSDTTIFQGALATTNISLGITNEANRLSATSLRKHGSAAAAALAALSGQSSTARQAAITVGDLDSVTNYLNVWGTMTTGSTEYGQLHAFTVEIMG